jgi:hypothetical protein
MRKLIYKLKRIFGKPTDFIFYENYSELVEPEHSQHWQSEVSTILDQNHPALDQYR